MKKLLGLFTALAITGVSGVASATFHLMTVSEVLTSADGNADIQFVEFVDSGEPFPAMAYVLEVFDATGTSLGTVPLDRAALAADQAAFYIGTAASDAKFGKTSSARLTVVLPTNGTVCFKAGSSYIHCLRYGSATGGPGNPSTGAAPPDGMSLQRRVGGSTYFVGAPTPKAPNVEQSVPDAGVPTADAAPGTPDATPEVVPDAAPEVVPDAAPAGTPDAGGQVMTEDSGCSISFGDGRGGLAALLMLAGGLVLAIVVSRRRR